MFLLIILFIFSSNDAQIDYNIPQRIGGHLILHGIEKDHYEFCEYDVLISYQPDNAGQNYNVGFIRGVIEDTSICDRMRLYSKLSIYSELQFTHYQCQYELAFEDGFNPKQVFTSHDLKSW